MSESHWPDDDGTWTDSDAVSAGCTCKSTLMDYVRRTVGHPYLACAFHGQSTPMDAS